MLRRVDIDANETGISISIERIHAIVSVLIQFSANARLLFP